MFNYFIFGYYRNNEIFDFIYSLGHSYLKVKSIYCTDTDHFILRALDCISSLPSCFFFYAYANASKHHVNILRINQTNLKSFDAIWQRQVFECQMFFITLSENALVNRTANQNRDRRPKISRKVCEYLQRSREYTWHSQINTYSVLLSVPLIFTGGTVKTIYNTQLS